MTVAMHEPAPRSAPGAAVRCGQSRAHSYDNAHVNPAAFGALSLMAELAALPNARLVEHARLLAAAAAYPLLHRLLHERLRLTVAELASRLAVRR